MEKIVEKVDEVIYIYEIELERQKRNNPRSIDVSRFFFRALLGHITHQAIKLVYAELIAAKGWNLDVNDEVSQVSLRDSCHKACHLLKRYSLLYKYWLYRCVVEDTPIPLSLIHPRWLSKAPEIVMG